MKRVGRRLGRRSSKPTVYKGIKYASKSEARYARYLDLCLKSKQIVAWERQVRVNLSVNGKKICAMVVDFRVTLLGGRVQYVEVKGWPEPVWKLKRKLFEALYPEYEYVVVPAKSTLNLLKDVKYAER